MPTTEPKCEAIAIVDQAEEAVKKPARFGHWIVLALVVLAIAAFLIFGPSATTVWAILQANLEDWQSRTDDYLLPALVVFFAVYAATTSLPLPVVTTASLLAGALFGRWLGTAVASFAYTLGVTISFLICRTFLRERIRRFVGKRLGRLERGMAKDGAFYLLTLRLIPTIPYYLINFLMALTPIRLRTYVVISWIGVLPLTFLSAGVGTELADVKSPKDIFSLPVIASLAALALVPMLIRKLVRWRAAAHCATEMPAS